MARDFEEIRDEVMRRLGRSGVTAFQSRAQEWVEACYRELCQQWFHHELVDDPVPTAAVSAATTFVAVPADCYLVFGVRLLSGSTPKARLGWMQPMNLFGRFQTTQGLPQHYTRFGGNLYFDRPANGSYTAEIYSYKRPADPDFATPSSPETDDLFDEILIEWATAKGQGALWRPELRSMGMESLRDFFSRTANPPVAAGHLRDSDETDRSDEPYGGGLG